jgi:hypothetical protein
LQAAGHRAIMIYLYKAASFFRPRRSRPRKPSTPPRKRKKGGET